MRRQARATESTRRPRDQRARVEVANVLRRSALAGDVYADVASMAHAELGTLPVELFPYAPFSSRAWELRQNVTSYDAWYIALAQTLGCRLATLDERLRSATRPLPSAQ